MKPETTLLDNKMESIYAYLTKTTGNSWGVTFLDLDEFFGCGITMNGFTRMGIGDTIHAALVDAVKLWGVNVPAEPPKVEVQLPLPLPPVEPPTLPKPTSGKLWTPERSEKMRNIKAKLHLIDNDQFRIHIETWSKGTASTVNDLKEENVDSFIKYMHDKYIDRIEKGGLSGMTNMSDQEERPF